jgi:hypothetical protein
MSRALETGGIAGHRKDLLSGLAGEVIGAGTGPARFRRGKAGRTCFTRTHDQLVVLAARAAAQDPADCRGYCSIIVG